MVAKSTDIYSVRWFIVGTTAESTDSFLVILECIIGLIEFHVHDGNLYDGLSGFVSPTKSARRS